MYALVRDRMIARITPTPGQLVLAVARARLAAMPSIETPVFIGGNVVHLGHHREPATTVRKGSGLVVAQIGLRPLQHESINNSFSRRVHRHGNIHAFRQRLGYAMSGFCFFPFSALLLSVG